jgi:hypothetical protein
MFKFDYMLYGRYIDVIKDRYRKIRRTQQKVICFYTGQLVSTQLWGHHQGSD